MPVCEVISIGTELLLGQILDTNCQFISTELAKLGIDCFFRTTVGDNKERIKEALRVSLNRSDIIVTTGGLGPTADDLTCECLAEFFGAKMIFDEEVCSNIEKLFKDRNIKMSPTNRKQALRPEGANLLPNPVGSAPGFIWELNNAILRCQAIDCPERQRTILVFPGVPSEMQAMWHQAAKPYLERKYSAGTVWSTELKHYGIGESALAEKYAHLLDSANPTVAPYAGRGECRLRITAKAQTVDLAKKLAQPVVNEILQGSGQLCYGLDDDTLESVVGHLLVEHKLTIAVAESCTGGLVSKRLTDIAGSSRYILSNVVTYADKAKKRLLDVQEATLKAYGAVSPQCAEEMAKGVRKLSNSDIGLSITGIAGPDGGSREKPVGLVYLGLAVKDVCIGKELNLGSKSSRSEIRLRAANEALNMVRLALINQSFT